MMLDDFFTLTEMNNGLTMPSRVKELVEVMQRETDSVVNNVGEAARQWSAVARAIAATENSDCLSLFVHLDGIHFIGKWLMDALKFAASSTDSCLEDSIIHILQAIGKLHVDYEKLVLSEIWITVKGLLVHQSFKVQEEAQILFGSWESWKKAPSDAVDGSNDGKVQKIGVTGGGSGHSVACELGKSLPLETSAKGVCEEPTRDEQFSTSSDASNHSSKVETTRDYQSSSFGDNSLPVLVRSPLLLKYTEDLPSNASDAVASTQNNVVAARQSTTDTNLTAVPETSSTGGIAEEFKFSVNLPFHFSSSASNPEKSIRECNSQKPQSDESMSLGTSASQGKNSTSFTMEEAAEFPTLLKSSGEDMSWENMKKKTSKDHVKMKKSGPRASGDNSANRFLMKTETYRESVIADKTHDIYVYGIVDPLELARQVAIEVQREVIDSGDQSCSSSEKLPGGLEKEPQSPNSLSGRHSKSSQGSMEEGTCDTAMSNETSLMKDESASSVENPDAVKENEAQDMDNSLVTEVSQTVNTEKPLCCFDLNQELSSEDADDLDVQVLTPIAIISSSGVPAAPDLSLSPLQFEGNLGWKGSAATSAFHPASPRRMSENDTELSACAGRSSLKLGRGCLDIDLNMVEISSGSKVGGLIPDKKIPISNSSPIYAECSLENNQTRPERFKLDLNCFSEETSGPSDMHLSHGKNGGGYGQSQRSIDLNDMPSFVNDVSDCTRSSIPPAPRTLNSHQGGVRPEDTVISIMGTRVKVSEKDFVSPNAFDLNMGRSGGFLGQNTRYSPGYGYHQNIASGSAVPFTSAVYGGPIVPYMVDSRGTVIPQIIAPNTGLGAGFSQSPYFINMTTSSSGPSNGAPRGSFDVSNRGGAPTPYGLLSVPPQLGRATDGSLSSFVSSSGSGKRKEAPETSAWDQCYYYHHPFPPPRK